MDILSHQSEMLKVCWNVESKLEMLSIENWKWAFIFEQVTSNLLNVWYRGRTRGSIEHWLLFLTAAWSTFFLSLSRFCFPPTLHLLNFWSPISNPMWLLTWISRSKHSQRIGPKRQSGSLSPTALHPIFFYQRQTLAATINPPSSRKDLFQAVLNTPRSMQELLIWMRVPPVGACVSVPVYLYLWVCVWIIHENEVLLWDEM